MQATNKSKTVDSLQVKYTCEMHPEVVTNKPGKCPKCGMSLVEKKDTKNEEKIRQAQHVKSKG